MCFKFCWFRATWEKLSLKSDIHIIIVGHFRRVNCGGAGTKGEEKINTQLVSSVGMQG